MGLSPAAGPENQDSPPPCDCWCWAAAAGPEPLNENVPRAIYKAGAALAGWQVLHQAGEAELAATRQLYEKLGLEAVVCGFASNLPAVLSASHLAVCRAGGTTLAELAAAGVPAILLPYPHAADDHQRKNAEVFVAAGGAVLLDEREVPGRLDDHLAAVLAVAGRRGGSAVGDGGRDARARSAAGRRERGRPGLVAAEQSGLPPPRKGVRLASGLRNRKRAVTPLPRSSLMLYSLCIVHCQLSITLAPVTPMSEIVRFSVSLEADLLEQFDHYCKEQQFATRSEAIRQLLHNTLTAHAWESDWQDAAGTLTLVYDHHRSQLRRHLTQVQHDHVDLVVSTLHAHLTHNLCLEVIVLRGPARRLLEIASRLRGLKGIAKGELVMASAGQQGRGK